VHLPVFSLLACTPARFGGLQRFLVNGFEREIEEYIFDLAGGDIFSLDLWPRLTDVSRTVGSLIF